MLAILWTSAQHTGLSEVSMKPVLHDDLCGLLELGSTAQAPLHIWSRQLWRRHLRHWPDTGRQQDAAEFLSFFRQACVPTHFQGAWRIISRNSLLDRGSVCPLVLNCVLENLPLERGLCTLQSMVDAWHSLPGAPTLSAGGAATEPLLHGRGCCH